MSTFLMMALGPTPLSFELVSVDDEVGASCFSDMITVDKGVCYFEDEVRRVEQGR